MTEYQETLDAWEAAGKPEIPHPVPGVDIHDLKLYLVAYDSYVLIQYPDEIGRIRRHLGLDT